MLKKLFWLAVVAGVAGLAVFWIVTIPAVVSASALPAYTSAPYPFLPLHPYIRRIYDAFGPRRMFWGTDLARMPCTYAQAIALFTEELPWLSADDKAWIMGRGLCEWLGWPCAATAPMVRA